MTDQNDALRDGSGATTPPPGSGVVPASSDHATEVATDDAAVRFAPPTAPPSGAVTAPPPPPSSPAPPPPLGPQPPSRPGIDQHPPAPSAPPPAQYTYAQQPPPPAFTPQPFGDHQVAQVAPETRRGGGAITGALMMLAGAIVAAIGAFLPWVSLRANFAGDAPNGFETYGFFGTDSDPIVWTNPGAYVIGSVAVVAVLAIIIAIAGKATWSAVVGMLATMVAGGFAFVAFVGIADLASSFNGVGIGPGIVMVAIGPLLAFVGSIVVTASR
ncbi:hypothetical protein [Ilumatobacter sp.]|uniref:hypothetical protein n=1 Tax=Ilumatobacter sp. TaxID=1967498 RepID=UPI003C4E7692